MIKKVSASVVRRLPRYYRYLSELDANGTERISSKELSVKMDVTASQIRQDLNCFGGFGQQGYGYNVRFLLDSIAKILGLDRGYNAILIGAGHMGRTFAVNTKFESRGFNLIGIFDSDPKKEGLQIGKHTVLSYSKVKSFIDENKPQMAILAVPKSAFLNFSHAELPSVDGIAIENVHLSDSLMRLSYKLAEKERSDDKL